MLGVSVWELPWDFKDGNLVCKKLVGHALSVPDREERHLLSEDLGSGEPVSRASARERKWSFFQQRKRPGSNKLLPSTEAVWCHYNFFQKQKRFGVF